jgi:HAD superfamily hydrolase (TIGR01509 family)
VLHPSTAIRALIFDFDGVIVDSERVEADRIIEVLATWGAAVGYRDFGHLFGTVDADREWDELVARWCGRTAAELEREIRPAVTPLKDALPLMPGVRELLDLAHERRLPVGLGTGNTLTNLRRRLGRHGVFDRFDAIVTREEVVSGKPAPDIYVEVARRLGVPAPTCLVLEDSVPGCQAALAADMQVIACPTAVTAHCSFPVGAKVVDSLLQVTL